MDEVMKCFDLTGRVAVVTGGAGLLGSSFVRALAEVGAHVAVVDLNGKRAATVASEVEAAYGQKALGIATDLTKSDSVQAAVDRIVAELGGVDVLVNAASLTAKGCSEALRDYFRPFEEYLQNLWELALQVNLTGLFLITQSCGREMLRRGRGSIINIASTYGVVAPDQRIYEGAENPYAPGQPLNTPVSYSVTKGAVLAFTRYLASYWGRHNIRVNVLIPGGVFDDHDDVFVKNYSARTMLGRMAEKNEYQAAVLFLASDASSYMTGANLIIDGGWTAW